jgi:hypothetical protein
MGFLQLYQHSQLLVDGKEPNLAISGTTGPDQGLAEGFGDTDFPCADFFEAAVFSVARFPPLRSALICRIILMIAAVVSVLHFSRPDHSATPSGFVTISPTTPQTFASAMRREIR